MTATTAIVQEGLQTIALASINPNPDNPRKIFDDAALKELAASIKAQGVWEPIVVRPDPFKPKTFELIIGERRWRASKLAGKSDIPAIVRNLGDREALEAMILENLQREDVHPIEEARGYQLLLDSGAEKDSPAHTVDSIAAKIGKSSSYVYARLKLLVLIPAAIEAFSQQLITPGHAVLIARLQPADQLCALFACFNESYDKDKELAKQDPLTTKFSDIVDDPLAALIPEKALREWIQDNINLKLKGVPWDLDDAQLVPEAGACATCFKRSTSNPSLFAELAIKGEDTCFDAACFQMKRQAFVKITLKNSREEAQEKNEAAPQTSGESGDPVPRAMPMLQLSDQHAYTKAKPDQAVYRAGQWLPAKPHSCPNVRKGILVRGEEAGAIKSVCVDDKCKVHKHGLSADHGRTNGSSSQDLYEERFRQHRRSIKEKKQARARGVLSQEVVKRMGAKLPAELTRALLLSVLEDRREDAEIVSWLLGEKKPLSEAGLRTAIDKAQGERLNQIVAAVFLTGSLENAYGVSESKEREELIGLAKAVGVKDAAKVLAAADKAIAAAKSCKACGCTEEVPCEYWQSGKRVQCSWKEEGLCSNPECVNHEARKGVSSEKSGGATEPSRAAR